MKNATIRQIVCVKCKSEIHRYSTFQFGITGAIHVNDENKVYDCENGARY